MIFFKTRHELKQLREEIQMLDRNLDRFFSTYNGTTKLVDEVIKLMGEHSAEVRKNTGGTFKLETIRPDPVVPTPGNGISIGRTNFDFNKLDTNNPYGEKK